jgi:DNA-directed RNA polymerase alpha subunit
MSPHHYEIREGPIEGLRLPVRAWEVLRRENITTSGQLRAVADRIHLYEDIGAKTAQVIRAELARIAALDEDQSPHP